MCTPHELWWSDGGYRAWGCSIAGSLGGSQKPVQRVKSGSVTGAARRALSAALGPVGARIWLGGALLGCGAATESDPTAEAVSDW